jgi:hypothetical protein
MTHVDDYLESPAADPIAKEFLGHSRRPAVDKDVDWLEKNMPFVTWRGRRYLCTGASRLGDVWLRELGSTRYYDHRVAVDELSNWERR